MNKICFLNNPGVISTVLNATLVCGLEVATRIGAGHGAMVAAILLDGKLYLEAQALGGDVAKENNPDRKWDDSPNVGINYTGYAIGKVMQSIRTDTLSDEGCALGYGESDSAGSYREICFCLNTDGDEVEFRFLTAYSGMKSLEDLHIAREASNAGWFEMTKYKNQDDSDTRLCRIAGGCRC